MQHSNKDMDYISLLRKWLPMRSESANKYTFGSLLIIAGSRGMTGAAVLAARAALRSGAGLVTVACPDCERHIIAGSLPEIITFGMHSINGCFSEQAAKEILDFIKSKRFNALLIGPGMSCTEETALFTKIILSSVDLPAIIDADALNSISKLGYFPALCGVPIITPHEGEACRLLRAKSIIDRSASVKELANICKGISVLKGQNTLISDGKTLLKNITGGSELAKGGSGDVLAGMIASIYMQNCLQKDFDVNIALYSAALAVYLHGLCGFYSAKKLNKYSVLATDLIEAIPLAFNSIEAG